MNTRVLLLALTVAGLSSCAAYKSGQTPDDVYYSPGRDAEQYVRVDAREEERYLPAYDDDVRLRQRIRDPRLRYIDNFDDDWYWRSRTIGSFNTWSPLWGTTWYNPWMWNNWGWYTSPFIMIPGGGTNIIVTHPNTPRNNTGIRYTPSIQTFSNGGNLNNSGKFGGGNSNGGSRYFNSINTGERRSSNSAFRNFFGGSNNSSYNNNYRTEGSGGSFRIFGNSNGSYNSSGSSGGSRTFSTGSSGSTSSGSSGGVRRN